MENIVVRGFGYSKINNFLVQYDSSSVQPKNGMIVTKVSNVDPESISECLDIVFEENEPTDTMELRKTEDVVIDMVKYSSKDKTISIYANRPFSCKDWNQKMCPPQKNVNNLVKQLENASKNPDLNDESIVSVQEVLGLFDECRSNYLYALKVAGLMPTSSEYISGYNKETGEIIFTYGKDSDKQYFIGKKDGKVYIKGAEALKIKLNYKLRGADLNEFYDRFMKCAEFYANPFLSVKTVGSDVQVTANAEEVIISVKSLFDSSTEFFRLSTEVGKLGDFYRGRQFTCKCEDKRIEFITKSNGQEIFESICVNLADCPQWMHQRLIELKKQRVWENYHKDDHDRFRRM